jgi:hypothetical protein
VVRGVCRVAPADDDLSAKRSSVSGVLDRAEQLFRMVRRFPGFGDCALQTIAHSLGSSQRKSLCRGKIHEELFDVNVHAADAVP